MLVKLVYTPSYRHGTKNKLQKTIEQLTLAMDQQMVQLIDCLMVNIIPDANFLITKYMHISC